MRRRISPTMLRLVLAIFALQLASSAAAIFFLRGQMNEVVRADRLRQLADVRDDLLATYYEGGRPALEAMIANRRGSAADPGVFIALSGYGATGQSPARPPVLRNLSQVPALPISSSARPVTVHRGADLPSLEGLTLTGSLPDGERLTVGVMGLGERRFNLAFATAIGLTISVAVALAMLSALLLWLVIGRRTHQIAQTAAELAQGNFGARVPEAEAGDGFDHLRIQINSMAERIDSLVSQLSSVSGALAHDLRSPVARLTAAIDTALVVVDGQGAGGTTRALEALQAARADAEGLRRMLETALEITRLEGGAIQDRRVPLDLCAIAQDLVELYEPLAEQAGITLVAQGDPAIVPCDRELVSRALANLIDNAMKYGGRNVRVSTIMRGAGAEISVADDGPGIPPADRARVVERFVRLDNARTLPGGGLGLAMVAAVARLHGGELVLGGDEGLVATLRLPA
ncbi:sensor histidine kinase KdpD [Novosphingobium sp. FKTRR1]|uniref:sensor histidine kinase n=1 Tax=Novosphingobium sp. FKTRR1 TaxID=2879118 RepID=UPI001CF0C76B|nr:HAMP domain-containing sensor histidine kinase [Novosphingobium sp. FKTRR1]